MTESMGQIMDYAVQAMEDRTARLGKAYMKSGRYGDAVEVFTAYFAGMHVLFGETFPPYHDFDSGDCYLLLAEAYLALGDTEQAMDAVEASVRYFFVCWKPFRKSRFHGAYCQILR